MNEAVKKAVQKQSMDALTATKEKSVNDSSLFQSFYSRKVAETISSGPVIGSSTPFHLSFIITVLPLASQDGTFPVMSHSLKRFDILRC